MTNLAMLLALESYTTEKVNTSRGIEEEIIGVNRLESTFNTDKVDKPEVSGCITNPPWEDDKHFLKAQDRNNTQVLMGAYCSVLLDPLPGEEYNVKLAADALRGKVVEPGEVFSQNQSLGPYTKSRGYREGASYSGGNIVQTEGGGVCKIASTLYNGVILSNLDIIERHNHSMPVNYVPYGQDATVAYGAKDFKFRNNTEAPILIWSEMVGHRLYIALYGQKLPPKVRWDHKIMNVVEAPIYYRENLELQKGEERVIIKGIDGATVESSIVIEHKSGEVETKNLGISHYNPMPHIIETNK